MTASHARVMLRPGGNAQAMLTWRVNPYPEPTSFDPDLVQITPPDEYAHLQAAWPGGPVRDGDIIAWPLRAAPAGPFPAGTGTMAGAVNGMCAALAAGGSAVAWTCSPGASAQQWTGYSDGTLRIGGRCLDVTGPRRRRQGRGGGVHRRGHPEMGDRPDVLQRLRSHLQHRDAAPS